MNTKLRNLSLYLQSIGLKKESSVILRIAQQEHNLDAVLKEFMKMDSMFSDQENGIVGGGTLNEADLDKWEKLLEVSRGAGTFHYEVTMSELSKALEAEYRESLQRKSDEAIYARRAAAVEQERKIRENELNTQITLEEKKKTLIDLNGKNSIDEAEYLARAKTLELSVYTALDPRLVLALALRDLSMNAQKIGSLTITSEILSSLLKN